MVTFTCNNCGDSVKKIRVVKHCSFECKSKGGGPNLCCIDCLKDFRDNYEAHTSCFTEDERYSAKGTFVAKESKHRDAKKQMSWSELIQEMYDQGDKLDATSKKILSVIKDADNVPRKEAKFKNFCKNNGNLRTFRENDISNVFNILQEESKKNIEAVKAAHEKEKQEKLEESKKIKEVNDKTTNGNENGLKKKKRKLENVEENGKEEIKIKKKKNDSNGVIEKVDNNNEEIITNGDNKKDTKKNKKKKIFKQKVLNILKEIDEIKIKSLKKKVIAAYGEEIIPNVFIENFNERLLKIPNVVINEKIVKLVE